MYGYPSPELEVFLLQELTEKGAKKLDNSIDISYVNVQRLVLKYLQVVAQSINFHLSQLLGLARASEKYGLLGINTQDIMVSQARPPRSGPKGSSCNR